MASGKTGNDLFEDCSYPKGSAPSLACMSYIAGLLDGIMTGFWVGSARFPDNEIEARQWFEREMLICMPDNIPVRQIRAIYERYLDENVTQRHLPASLLLLASLKEAFPCR